MTATLLSAGLIEPVIDPPPPTELNPVEKKLLLFYLEHLGSLSPEHSYRLAAFYIQTGEFSQARIYLEKAIALDPEFTVAYVQLGFLDVWEGRWKEAFESFSMAEAKIPCDPKCLMGLARVAIHWADEKSSCARLISEKIALCHSQDPDSLLYLGILYTRLGEWEKGEKTLQECLEISPHYQDAHLQLAHLYILEKKFEAAEAIYLLFPQSSEADKGLARIASQRGDFATAEALYRKALETKPDDLEARVGLAQALAAQLQYTQAKQQYALLLREQAQARPAISVSEAESHWIQSMDVKSLTNVAFLEQISYTDAKEWDPTLGVPVVKDYYFSSKFTLQLPIFNRWRIDVQQLYFHQRENNILAHSVNYSAFVNGGSLLSHYYFAKDWKWDLVAKVVHASGLQQANYPFKSSTLFEPGTTLFYRSDWNLFVLDAHREDLIIKNFSSVLSQLLRIDNYHGIYGFHPPVYLHPSFELWAGQNFYRDALHNRKDFQKVQAKTDLFTRFLIATYVFEHGHFQHLSQSYFSYQKQIQHTLSVRYMRDFDSKVQCEVWWDHIWQSSRDVFLPIGSFVFVSPHLYLIGNRITALLQYRFKDRLRAEIEGHYLTFTLPYHDWNVRGSLFWQF